MMEYFTHSSPVGGVNTPQVGLSTAIKSYKKNKISGRYFDHMRQFVSSIQVLS